MNDLRTIRIFLATILLVASLAWLFIGPQVNPMAAISFKSQIIPSALSVTIGATAVWLVATFVFGRLYCATVCPIGTLQDMVIRSTPKWRHHRPFRYAKPHRYKWDILLCYAIALLLGFSIVGFVIEPWNILANTAVLSRKAAVIDTWTALGINSAVGAACGVVMLLAILVWAAFKGRAFCTEVCPIGTALGGISERALLRIEIDPDRCTSCMRCSDVCAARCIDVKTRHVDNAKCVRCFDCLKVCEDDAIHYQFGRNRRSTPLLQPK